MDVRVRDLLSDLKERLQTLYGDRLDAVVLYGSHARGEASSDSDVDVMVVLNGDVNPVEEIEHTSEAAYDVSLSYDRTVTILPVSASVFTSEPTSFLDTVRREGVQI